MTTSMWHKEVNGATPPNGRARTSPGDAHSGPHLTSEQVWQALAKATFAVVSYVTPSGEPRSSGVVFKTVGRRLYVAVAPDSWKAKHISVSGRVAVVATVRRGGVVSLVVPIPPATIGFHGAAIVHRADSEEVGPLVKELGSLLPAERRGSASLVEIVPEGEFLTYGVGVSLRGMRTPAVARGRAPVS